MRAAALEDPLGTPRAVALAFARLLGVTALLGLTSALWLYASYNGGALLAHRPPLISFGDALGTGLLDWCLWLPLWPLLRALARRWPLRRGAWRLALLVHALVAAVCSLLQLTLFALASVAERAWLYAPGEGWTLGARVQRALQDAFAAKFKSGVLVAALALIALETLEAWKRARASELRSEQLGRALAEARLAALNAALEPHFLFNALNTIQALVRDEPATAERMIARLGDLLRAALATNGHAEVTLAEELMLLESYLAIERERFGARLRVELDVPPELLSARVPAMLLQPLAENAVRHGLARRSGAAALALAARERDGRLSLRLRDDGPGAEGGGAPAGFGLGLASARARLAALHGAGASLELARVPGGGMEVAIELPYVEAPAAILEAR